MANVWAKEHNMLYVEVNPGMAHSVKTAFSCLAEKILKDLDQAKQPVQSRGFNK